MDQNTVEAYILNLPGVQLTHPFGEEVAVFSTDPTKPTETMVALIDEHKQPLRLSLRCDPQLAQVLRGKYEEIMPAKRLNPKQWNTLVLSGQLDWPEVQALIRHSYQLVTSS